MARKRRKHKVRSKRKAKTSAFVVNPLVFTNLKSDDLAILSTYIEIISNIIGLWSLYLARMEDEQTENANSEETPILPEGAVRSEARRKRHRKRKRKLKSRP